MNDSTRRSLRTGIDLVLGVLASFAAVFLIPGLSEQFTEAGLGEVLGWFALIVTILTVFLNKLKNYLEDNTNFPAVLKAPASGGENPVPDNPHQGEHEGRNL